MAADLGVSVAEAFGLRQHLYCYLGEHHPVGAFEAPWDFEAWLDDLASICKLDLRRRAQRSAVAQAFFAAGVLQHSGEKPIESPPKAHEKHWKRTRKAHESAPQFHVPFYVKNWAKEQGALYAKAMKDRERHRFTKPNPEPPGPISSAEESRKNDEFLRGKSTRTLRNATGGGSISQPQAEPVSVASPAEPPSQKVLEPPPPPPPRLELVRTEQQGEGEVEEDARELACELWSMVLDTLRTDGKSYAVSWLDRLRPIGLDGVALVLNGPDRFFRGWVTDHWELMVLDALKRLDLGTTQWLITSPDEGGPPYVADAPKPTEPARKVQLVDFILHTQGRRVEWGMGEDTWPTDEELEAFWGNVEKAGATGRICGAWDAYAKCDDPKAAFVSGGHPMRVFIREKVWKARIGKQSVASAAAQR